MLPREPGFPAEAVELSPRLVEAPEAREAGRLVAVELIAEVPGEIAPVRSDLRIGEGGTVLFEFHDVLRLKADNHRSGRNVDIVMGTLDLRVHFCSPFTAVNVFAVAAYFEQRRQPQNDQETGSGVDAVLVLLMRLSVLAGDRATVQDQAAAHLLIPEEERLVHIGVQRDVTVLPEEAVGHRLAESTAGELIPGNPANHAMGRRREGDVRFHRFLADRDHGLAGIPREKHGLDEEQAQIEALNKAGGIIVGIDADPRDNEVNAVFAVAVHLQEGIEIGIHERGAPRGALVEPAAEAKRVDIKVAAAATAGFVGLQDHQFAAGDGLQLHDHVIAESRLVQVDGGVLHGVFSFHS